jgi:alpha-mannosidase
MQFSTASDYMNTVTSLEQNWPKYNGDFFPYVLFIISNQRSLTYGIQSWETGFYASRPAFKDHVRIGERTSRTAETLFALSQQWNTSNYNKLLELRSANGIVQHHDAVTGTSFLPVYDDYENMLSSGSNAADYVAGKSLLEYMKRTSQNVPYALSQNVPTYLLDLQELQVIPFVVYNSLAWNRKQFVRIEVNLATVNVLTTADAKVPIQINILGPNRFEIYFETDEIPALGYLTYSIVVQGDRPIPMKQESLQTLSNDVLTVTFDENKRISSINNKISDVAINIKQDVS